MTTRRRASFREEFAGTLPTASRRHGAPTVVIILVFAAAALALSFVLDWPSGAAATGTRVLLGVALGFAAMAAAIIGNAPVSGRRGGAESNGYIAGDGSFMYGVGLDFGGHDDAGGGDGGDGGSD